MIRIDIPEGLIEDILLDIKKLKHIGLTDSTKRLFKEIKIQEGLFQKYKLTEKEIELGFDLGGIFDSLSYDKKIKSKIMSITLKHLGDDFKFHDISTNLNRKYISTSLLEKPEKTYYNLNFDLIVSYKISSEDNEL